MEKIKLVIWDMDETFWRGTLSEGGINIIQKNIEIVKELTNRGIINSIVSKNNHDEVQTVLEKEGIWDYFIFPIIDWLPKGEAVKTIIEKCQLRAPNILFIDDNISNLKEVEYYNEGINVVLPDFISGILSHSSFQGKNDFQHSRLIQYKLLEKKDQERSRFYNNTSFLEDSEIQIIYIDDLMSIKERIYELIERTNQLNFTKNRLNQDEIDILLNNSQYEQRAINVVDKYGDYGIVGYYCYDLVNNQLLHFVFSCRILNLGVEQYIYSQLNFPKINIIPEVSIQLDNSTPHWISLKVDSTEAKKDITRRKYSFLFKGGCDLSQMLHYIKGRYNIDIIEETNYVGLNNMAIHADHTQVILNSNCLTLNDLKYIESSLPFFDKDSHKIESLKKNFDVVIYSVLMDYTQDLYRHKTKKFLVPFGGYLYNLTDETQHLKIAETFRHKNVEDFSVDFLKFFSDEYEYIGQESPEQFIKNLKEIRKLIKSSTPIIFINGSEIDDTNTLEIGSRKRHVEMNKALDDFISTTENCYLLDVRQSVKTVNDITNNIRHYRRDIYIDLSNRLMQLLEEKKILSVKYDRLNHIQWILKKIVNKVLSKF